ncbi:hypothetical protein [Arenimonas sp.]|uniref:hypothetical protein n=1 Tax=Arenimonas sp. TaxID=1872635 RepID=UPI0035B05FC7
MNHRKDPGATPSLGALDQLDLDRTDGRERAGPPSPRPPERPERPSGRSRRSPWPWLLLVLAVLVVAGALALSTWRDTLSQALIPSSELNREIEAAQMALARGELSRADGQGARERFQAVLARDPDHPAARSGLVAVREAALVHARAALAAGDFDDARRHLGLARSMAAPADDLAGIEAELATRESAEADIAQRLQAARDAQAQGRIEQQGTGALAIYEDVLRLQSDNAIALEGRRSLLSGLLSQAESALAEGDLRTAGALVDRVVKADPSHLGLPAVQARLGEVRARGEQAREAALQAAQAELRAGRLDAAARGFQALLAERPDDVEARQGMDDAAAMLAARAGRHAADFDFEAATDAIERARGWAPDSPAVAAAERRLGQARAARDEVPARPADPGQLSALLDEAAAAMRAGDLVDPPGGGRRGPGRRAPPPGAPPPRGGRRGASAWDLLRRAQALAPDDGGVRRGFAEYSRRARACFEDELAGNRLGAAQACLDALVVRDRGGDELAADRRRLADRWLAFGEERLGAGEFALARRALSAAREVDPSNPRLQTFAERLRRAGG